MTCTACFVCLVSTASGCLKNALGRASASGGNIAKLKQYTFLRYLCFKQTIETKQLE
jgi:hypothetical protein